MPVLSCSVRNVPGRQYSSVKWYIGVSVHDTEVIGLGEESFPVSSKIR